MHDRGFLYNIITELSFFHSAKGTSDKIAGK